MRMQPSHQMNGPPPIQSLQHTPMPPPPPPSRTPAHPIVIGENKVDQLTEQWIRSNCFADKDCVTPRGELYAAYVDDLRNQYHSLSGSLSMFSNIMKSIHPDVQFKMADNGLMMVAQGIRLVKPHKLAPASASSIASPLTLNGSSSVCPAPAPSSHPLMKQILTKGRPPIANGIGGMSSSNESSRSSTPHEEIPMMQPSPMVHQVKEEPGLKSEVARRILQEEGKRMNGVANGATPTTKTAAASAAASDDSVDDENNVKPTIASLNKESSSSDESCLMCEWDGCGERFSTGAGVLRHCAREHMQDEAQACRWPGCDGTPRSRWSLVTHIQDHHAQEHQLKAAAQRRRDGQAPAHPTPYRTDIPRDIPQHPGYAKHAAIDAIRRHAFNFLPRDITDEPEGPVTKSIRLTSCLILRNLARYSAEGRHLLRRHERLLCWLALSRLESSHALAQLLAELHPLPEDNEKEDVAPIDATTDESPAASLTSA